MGMETEFLPAALEVQESPPSPAGRAIAASIMAFFSLAVVWALVGRVDIVATAGGRIVPDGRVKLIQPVEIGVVRRIHVREGQAVEAGDPLIDLDPTRSRADLSRLEQTLTDRRLDAARRRRLLDLLDGEASGSLDGPPGLSVPPALAEAAGQAAVALQARRLHAEWAAYRARRAALTDGIASREAELAALRDQVAKRTATLPLITRRARSLKTLAERKLAPEQNWLELEQQRIEQRQELAASRHGIERLQAAIREARQQRRALEAGVREETLDALAEAMARIRELEQERIKALRRTRLRRLTAPVAGVVQQLAVHTVGGVVTPAQELMKLVPRDGRLEVEAWVLNRDIGFVHEGQAAEIKVEAFPYTRYGTLDGELVDISDDAVTDDEKGLVYAARVRMKQASVQVGGHRVALGPGMAVTVEVKTGQRRLIEFLLSPLLRYRAESLRER